MCEVSDPKEETNSGWLTSKKKQISKGTWWFLVVKRGKEELNIGWDCKREREMDYGYLQPKEETNRKRRIIQ